MTNKDNPQTIIDAKPLKCFCIMPFSNAEFRDDQGNAKIIEADEWKIFFEDWIKKAVESFPTRKIECFLSELQPGSFIRGIVEYLESSDLVIAVLTGSKPNIYYEMGIRHALKRGTIIITQSMNALPSDLSTYCVVKYEYSDSRKKYEELYKDFESKLHNVILRYINREIFSDSPVTDFLGDDRLPISSAFKTFNIKNYTLHNLINPNDVFLKINHSETDPNECEVPCSSETIQEKKLAEILQLYIVKPAQRPQQFSELKRTFTNSDNFKATLNDASYLIRIHRQVQDTEVVDFLGKLNDLICNANIFSQAEYIQPTPSKDEKKYISVDDNLVQLFPYLEKKSYFNGKAAVTNERWLCSYAEKLAQVQTIFFSKEIEPEEKAFLDASKRYHERYHWKDFFGKSRVLSPGLFLDWLQEINRYSSAKSYPSEFSAIIAKEYEYLSSLIQFTEERIESFEAFEKKSRLECEGMFLHDCHPHNAFFSTDSKNKGECILIYDYETISDYWSHYHTLSFAVHRFTREIAVSHSPARNKGAIEAKVRQFLKHYELALGSNRTNQRANKLRESFNAEQFIKFLPMYIRVTNLVKLLRLAAFQFNIIPDSGKRVPEHRMSELIKLIMLIKEAEYYDFT